MPDVTFQDGAGATLALSAWKGRVALINLWATWCGPCRKEMPALAALQKDLGSKDFEVVAVSLDMKGIPASSAFLKETGADALALYADPTRSMRPVCPSPYWLTGRAGRRRAWSGQRNGTARKPRR
jgi:thiol-disulfide isomerase/thioredoxin